MPDFTDIGVLDYATLRQILADAKARKRLRDGWPRGVPDADRPLEGRILAMIFEKPSTRTRVSFEVAMRQLGGQTIEMSGSTMQLDRGETVTDTAKVLSRYVDAIMIRTPRHEVLEELAAGADVPVINGLTDRSHPCQVMGDIMTFEEQKGPIQGAKIAWIGDGNNMAATWIQASAKFGFRLELACPSELSPDAEVLSWAQSQGASIKIVSSAAEAAAGADCVVTDVWLSMSDESPNSPSETTGRRELLVPFQVNSEIMSLAQPQALFMHCLPAHRGQEVTGDVIDGSNSVVWAEAENRLHVQKGILNWCMT
ncbi:MAG: ornithine carbamoyltransferase [Alphaproteobacteria bacterium]|nr:ornithine carbamoyltransferase [Alphaproteobacteria bacterium]